MLTEKEIELEARLVAIENIVVHMAAFSLGLVPDEVIKIAHAQIRQHLRGVTIPGSIDPSLKDHVAGLIYENSDRLLADIEQTVKRARSRPG